MLKQPPSILVVDDDESVRDIVVTVLREAGFEVRATASGWTALSLIKRKKFDLLVADIGLPDGLSGLELAQCARISRPMLKCLFISGRLRAVTDDPERDDFVGKPFRQRELLGCVWELLQRRISMPPLDWEVRQAERSLLAAEVNCRRKKFLAQRRARRQMQG
jgi:DNA-binding response OmpR family regulator